MLQPFKMDKLKEEFSALSKERDAIEANIAELNDILSKVSHICLDIASCCNLDYTCCISHIVCVILEPKCGNGRSFGR